MLTAFKRVGVAVLFVALFSGDGTGQTVITEPKNKYTPAEDVKLGREAAAQAERELPILSDDRVTSYLTRVGGRLVESAPQDLQHKEFRYTFKVVNQPEINAFALPGGPTYFNRGMILAARTEGEVAGVMAHEVSHVLLRHGTAQATKATKYELGQLAGMVLGSIVGGNTGRVIAQGSQLGIGAAFLRFSREYERQADLLGAQIMARAGYDPRDVANMFRTIAQQRTGSGGPEWLSSHPDPGNRYEYVMREAQSLRVENPVRDTAEFPEIKQRLDATQPARASGAGRSARSGAGVDARHNVELPSSEFRSYQGSDGFEVRIPANWRELPGTNGVTFAPEGAYAQGTFSHGVEIGFAQASGRDLPGATREFIAALRKSNPELRDSASRAVTVDGRAGLDTLASNRSQDGVESVRIVATLLPDGTLFYIAAVVPSEEDGQYRATFDEIIRSVRLQP